MSKWIYHGTRIAGGKMIYSPIAIETCLLIREFYHLPYRQTQGLVESSFKLMQLDLDAPDYSTLAYIRGKKE
ncbi:hypothetical protein NOVO_00490 [Rickettsiales bacterium Ac37b]|nr:hypothetical protein NOVO_00490 [Rickettsiales bacterium Ac37b]